MSEAKNPATIASSCSATHVVCYDMGNEPDRTMTIVVDLNEYRVVDVSEILTVEGELEI